MKTSAKRQFRSDRQSIRHDILSTEIRGFIRTTDIQGHIPCVVWDVTPEGLGVWIPTPISVQKPVIIVLNTPSKPKIQAIVRWCQMTMEPDRGFRAGLEVSDGYDLSKLLE
jgi:hypothetical protein